MPALGGRFGRKCAYGCGSGLHNKAGGDEVVGVGVGVGVDGGAAGGLAEERDPLGVPAESTNIIAHPFDSKALVEDAEVVAIAGGAGETEDVEAVAGLRVSKKMGLRG